MGLTERKYLTTPFLSIILCSSFLLAGGFSIYEQGTRAMGMAGAFTARADDPSALFYNPAGMAFQYGLTVYGGVTLIGPESRFAGVGAFPGFGVQEKTRERTFFPPHFYLNYKATGRFALGVGVSVPYGLATEWEDPESFSGRYISQKAQLDAFFIHPQAAYLLTERLSLAAGIQIVRATVDLERVQNQPFNGAVLDVADIKIEGDNGVEFGFNAGLLYKAHRKWQLGLVYRSKVTNSFSGSATFTQISTNDPALDAMVAAGLPANASGANEIGIATELTLPWQFAAGILFNASDRLSFEFDYMRFGWSVFERLEFDFASRVAEGDQNTPENSFVVNNYEDANQFRLGAQYTLSERFALRAGWLFDDTPVPTESVSLMLPDMNRHDITIGLGYYAARFSIDAAYMVVIGQERSTDGVNRDNYNGVYNAGANLFGLSVGYRFK